MTAFVEDCRREWRRLGVPDGLADEMATDLEADLAEAQADGVSAAEMLGESDPRRFAANWANERGLVSERPPKQSRARLWIGLAAAFVVMFFVVLTLVGGLFATGTVSMGTVQAPRPVTVGSVAVPNLVGLKACRAVRMAVRAGFNVHLPGHAHGYNCDAVVDEQVPAAGEIRRRDGFLTLRLRG